MNETFSKYVRSLGIGEALFAHIEALSDQCQRLAPEPFEEIAVSEVVQQDGSKIYDLLYFFSNGFICEVENFVSNPTIWLAPLQSGPAWLKIEKVDFDLKEAKPTSRFSVDAHWWSAGFTIHPKACGDNCTHLLKLTKRYLIRALGTRVQSAVSQ